MTRWVKQLIVILGALTGACGPQSVDATNLQAVATVPPDAESIRAVVKAAQDNLLRLQVDGKLWDMPSYLGLHYTAQYYLFLQWSQAEHRSSLDVPRLRRELTEAQLANGAWAAVRDHTSAVGDINPTVMNYAALKAMGEPVDGPVLAKARRWILEHGGIEATNALNKAFFAAFHQVKWEETPYIPYELFIEGSIVHPERLFAQWIGPHVFPMAYLREQGVARDLGAAFRLDEIRLSPASKPEDLPQRAAAPKEAVKVHLERMLAKQRPRGSFGAYTLATMLTVMVMDDVSRTWPAATGLVPAAARAKAEDFLEALLLNNRARTYQGVVDDGHLWDTALVLDALLESGVDPAQLAPSAHYLASRQVEGGGLPFGDDFEVYPDTDDTSFAVAVWARYPELKQQAIDGTRFLLSMQNSDGGMGAFARNNNPVRIIDLFVRKLANAADLYDESSADIIGHVMEGIGRTFGKQKPDFSFFKNAVDYLEKTRDPDLKAWKGRWGVNYLYGTSAVVCGLAAMGHPIESELIQGGLAFIASRQNPDGGFGETTASDLDKTLAGKGQSTPSQTAWALMALLEDRPRYAAQIDRAVRYLELDFRRTGRWVETQAVGTGHPGIVYMEYPSYPYVFPLKALARYLAKP